MTAPTDPVWIARSSLAAAGRTESLTVRTLHIGVARNAISSLEAELVSLRISLAAAEAEIVRLSGAEAQP